MMAYEILARIYAGLQMCGQNEDGDMEWLGTYQQWQRVEEEERKVLSRTWGRIPF